MIIIIVIIIIIIIITIVIIIRHLIEVKMCLVWAFSTSLRMIDGPRPNKKEKFNY